MFLKNTAYYNLIFLKLITYIKFCYYNIKMCGYENFFINLVSKLFALN